MGMKWFDKKRAAYYVEISYGADLKKRTSKQVVEVIRNIGEDFINNSKALASGCCKGCLHFEIDIQRVNEQIVSFSIKKSIRENKDVNVNLYPIRCGNN